MSHFSEAEIAEFRKNAKKAKETGDYSWLNSPPYDMRFPNVNQTPNCRQNFIDYFRCKRLYGEDHKPCNYFRRIYQLICPSIWIEEWESQLSDGTYPYRDLINR
ncbi:unnamed protein product [Dicrocoelium dendriticum]|nr:unnamed protein product [Dicrocoelium dendriticum]